MQTTNTKARSDSATRKARLIAAACIAATLLVGLGIKLWLDHRVPPPDADAGQLARYMISPAFAALPDAQKAPYLAAFQRANDRGELTPELQRGVIHNINNPTGKNPIQQYFSLSPKERETFLDDIIDRVLKADKLHPRPTKPDKEGEAPTPIDRGRLADAIPPQERAQMAQFLQDLHDRRTARGLPDDGRFLFNRAN